MIAVDPFCNVSEDFRCQRPSLKFGSSGYCKKDIFVLKNNSDQLGSDCIDTMVEIVCRFVANKLRVDAVKNQSDIGGVIRK